MRIFQSNILLNLIIHNDLNSYNESGYGGKEIVKWPFYKFIKIFIEGNNQESRYLWVNWLTEEFLKYCLVSKFKGGMYQGSVHRYAIDFLPGNKKRMLVRSFLDCK